MALAISSISLPVFHFVAGVTSVSPNKAVCQVMSCLHSVGEAISEIGIGRQRLCLLEHDECFGKPEVDLFGVSQAFRSSLENNACEERFTNAR